MVTWGMDANYGTGHAKKPVLALPPPFSERATSRLWSPSSRPLCISSSSSVPMARASSSCYVFLRTVGRQQGKQVSRGQMAESREREKSSPSTTESPRKTAFKVPR